MLQNVETNNEMTESAPTGIAYESTIFAEPIWHIGSFPVTNSLMNSWLVILILLVLGLAVRSRIRQIPRGIQNALEAVFEMFLGVFDPITGSRQRSYRFLPFILCFFLFILISNWMGLLPGVGSVGQVVAEHGEKVFIPYFRGGTADLNTTLALAIFGVVASHIFGVMTLGSWQYLNKFINLKALLVIPKKFWQDPTIIIVNPIKVFVGLIEIVGEAAKVASLSLRLFGNIFAGEVLLASMSAILAFGIPIPFIFLEIIVGLVQALIFSILILAYLTMNTSVEEH